MIGRNLKVIGTNDGSNNLGVWRRSPQPPEANGGLGEEPPMLRRFSSLFIFLK